MISWILCLNISTDTFSNVWIPLWNVLLYKYSIQYHQALGFISIYRSSNILTLSSFCFVLFCSALIYFSCSVCSPFSVYIVLSLILCDNLKLVQATGKMVVGVRHHQTFFFIFRLSVTIAKYLLVHHLFLYVYTVWEYVKKIIYLDIFIYLDISIWQCQTTKAGLRLEFP